MASNFASLQVARHLHSLNIHAIHLTFLRTHDKENASVAQANMMTEAWYDYRIEMSQVLWLKEPTLSPRLTPLPNWLSDLKILLISC